MEDIFLLLGSNMGNREDYLLQALDLIIQRVGPVELCSSFFETAAWGKTDQPDFINQAISLKSDLSPLNLLEVIWSIEDDLNRIRQERWGARTIDIDILFYGSDIINLPDLIIPHKLLHHRRFVLMPLNEIAPNLMHPVLMKTINQLLLELTDDLSVKKSENFN
ncbi:2-amino-4-hydroxy-6-hydroxymethyldihydropteridine diphosphokinase [Pedobacter sp. P351]|uniref:2-amino-4-hydroxy-6- hydroxymethyldihydropteridine diphosphokinase n=1 Tax=Pedobacter superstes TaxID=3133441 RepID=UPI0030AD0037